MCGIVAAASQSNIISILADGLKHLEYRGYDSSGIAFIQNKNISSYKKQGNVSELTQSLDKNLMQILELRIQDGLRMENHQKKMPTHIYQITI